MMTSSAKADGFLGNEVFRVDAHRPHPGLESTSQDIPGRVLISGQGQAASRAGVLPDRNVLANFRSASTALLTRTPRIYRNHSGTGAFSLVSQDHQEAAPCGIRNCPAEPVVPDHPLDIQALHRDQTVATNQFQSCFIMMLAPLVRDMGMKNANDFDGFTSIRSALLLATQGALGAAQGREFFLKKTRVFDDPSIRSGQEVFEANIDSHGGQCTRLNVDFAEVTGQNHEPLVALALEHGRLDVPFYGSVNLAADHSDVLHAEPVIVEADTISVRRKFDAIETIFGLESWIARLLSRLHAPEESDESFIKTAHRGLSRGEVESREVGVDLALCPESCRLFKIAHSSPSDFIGDLALFQAGVIKTAMRLQHDAEFTLLIGVCEEAKFESTSHLFPRVPHKVVFDREDCAAILSVLAHTYYYTHVDNLVNSKEWKAAIPLSAKADSPLAA